MMDSKEPENKLDDIFGIGVTANAANNLRTAALWGRAMAVLGFFNLGISILVLVKTLIFYSTLDNGSGYIAGVLLSTLLTSVLLFFMYFFLYRYAAKMLSALDTESQEKLGESFGQLKAYFRFIGILLIVSVAVVILSIIFGRLW